MPRGGSEIPDLARLPEGFRREIAAAVPIPVTGMGGARVWRLARQGEDRFLKIARNSAVPALKCEIERTKWLRCRGVPVPAVLMEFTEAEAAAVLMTRIPGAPLPDSGCEPARAVCSVARALAALHALPAAECPFDETLATRLARAREDIAHGRVDAGHFASRNRGASPEQIYRRLEKAPPPAEDLVVVHGDAAFDNILVDARGAVGFIDCGHAGRGDRYVDLAVLTEEIEAQFGIGLLDAFLDAYGLAPWDEDKARFYRDLYELF